VVWYVAENALSSLGFLSNNLGDVNDKVSPECLYVGKMLPEKMESGDAG
jgi:hypothetical protein